MRIPCPFCGLRDHAEFFYEGDATVAWPELDCEETEPWIRAVFQRRNPAGRHTEYWQHAHGCRAWLEVERNTITHEILGARIAHRETEGALEEERRMETVPPEESSGKERL